MKFNLTHMDYENLIPGLLAIALAAVTYYVLVQLADWLYIRKQKRIQKDRYHQQMEEYAETLREKNILLQDDLRQSTLREAVLKEECKKLSGRNKLLANEIMSDDMNKHTVVLKKNGTTNVQVEELILE